MQMATLDTARKLLEDLRVASYPAAERELAEIRQFAKDQVGPLFLSNCVAYFMYNPTSSAVVLPV